MELRTKNRIIGLLSLIVVIVLLIPFMQPSHHEAPTVVELKPPAFPDQAAAITETQDDIIDLSNESADTISAPAEQSQEKTPEKSNATAAAQEQNLFSSAKPYFINDKAENEKPKANTNSKATSSSIKLTTPKALIVTQEHLLNDLLNKEKAILKKQLAHHADKKPIFIDEPLDKNGLIKIKNLAWAIQLGSFANKKDAIRLANRLRAKGYHAFIQNMHTMDAHRIEVYIGPEEKQKAAFKLADQIKKEFHLDGIIIRYQPLKI